MIKLSKQLILGSKSPRRSFLLKQLNIDFEVFTREVDESYPSNLNLSEIAQYIAAKKAIEIFPLINPDHILMTADSVVVCDDQIFGKPKNFDHAFSTLKQLSDNVHIVYTGVCIKSKKREVNFTDKTRVTLSKMTDLEIETYIKQYQPFDKAGSYGIQDWIGFSKVISIEGSYANIMGLPTHAVYQQLMHFI